MTELKNNYPKIPGAKYINPKYKEGNDMTLTHYTDMVVRIMDDYVKKNGTDTIMTNKEIQDYLYKQRVNYIGN